MLRIFQSTSASDAQKYYSESLAQEDYYTEGRDIAGNWYGEAAKALGLSGPVDGKGFARLCKNLDPRTGERLTPRTRDDRTVGYDISYHVPKGVSLVHALTGDRRIVEVFRRSVEQTMRELEANTHTRVRLPGPDGKPKSEDRQTGNLVWGEFVHFTSRPVDGVPDPHLHLHCFAFNATRDQDEGRWKAAQFRQIVRDHPYFQAAFHSRLAAGLEDLGYEVARGPEGWDLAGIDRGLVEKFSRRTAEIEAIARERGITDPTEIAGLGARSRAKKAKGLSVEALRQQWASELSEDERAWIADVAERAGVSLLDEPTELPQHAPEWQQPVAGRDRVTPTEAIDHAIGHVFERKSVESERRLLAEALKFSLGDVSPEEMAAELSQRSDILTRHEDGEQWITTREVLEEEKAVLGFAVEGKGTQLPLGAGYGGRSGERYAIGSLADGIELNTQQRSAVEHLLSSRDRVMMLRGGAGTGKSTLLREAAAGIQEGGKRIFACAVTSDASRGGLRELGFHRAETLQKLLTDRRLQEQVQDQVIWVDEAGMVGTPTMRRLFEVAKKQNARVILSGDTRQHAPVERGDAMRLLERRAEVPVAEVTEIVRQKGVYKDAVAAMTRGELATSVELLDELDAIREVRDHDDPQRRHEELAERYLDAVSRGRSALVVSPTHAEGSQVTRTIRAKLRAAERLRGEDRTFVRLQDQQWTDAQKADARNYEPGMIVQYTQHCPGVHRRGIAPAAAGTRARVLAVDGEKGLVTTEDAAGHRRAVPLNMADRFQVFREQELPLAVGDRIRVTRNGHTLDGKHRLTNGSLYRVAGFTKDGHIELDNKGRWVVSRHVSHITHGYCTTPQAAQGKTVDHCLAAVSADSLTTSTLEQIYVILSRASKSVELLTDKRSALINAVARLTPERSASDLADPPVAATRQQRLQQHAFEVARLRSFESARRELGRSAMATSPGRGRQTRQRSGQQRPDRGRDRDRGGLDR